MTFIQMYNAFQTLWDKAGNPYMPEEQFDEIANIKYNDFVTEECKKLEEGAEHTNHIFNLYKHFQKQNSRQIDFPADVNDFRYPVRFTMKYQKNCKNVITYPEVGVRKADNNSVDQMQNDPFNVGIDADPTYTPTRVGASPNTSFVVNSTTIPLNLSLVYIRIPQKIDSKNNPNTNFELPDYVANEIIRSIVLRSDVVIENINRAQAEAAEPRVVPGLKQ